MRIGFWLVIIMFFMGNESCRKREPLRWNQEWIFPIIQGALGLEDLIPDSILVSKSDGTLAIETHISILDTSLQDLITWKDTSMEFSYHIRDFTLKEIKVKQSVSLGQICEKGGITGATIIANHGSTITVPSLNSNTPNAQEINAGNYFNSLEFESADLEISMANEFPIDLTQLIFSLANTSDGSLILQDTFPIIPANGGKATHLFSLKDKKIESILTGTILNISSPGSQGNPVLIDTAQKSIVSFSIRNARVKSISAIFPASPILDVNSSFTFNIGQIQAVKVKMKQGNLELNTKSTLPVQINFDLSSSKITQNTGMFNEKLNIPGGGVTQTKSFSLDEKTLWLNGGPGYNTLDFKITGSVDSSGTVQTISSQDSITIKVKLIKPLIQKFEGYLGTSKYSFQQKLEFSKISSKFPSGFLLIPESKIFLKLYNQIGAQVEFIPQFIYTKKNASQINLQGPILQKKWNIGRAFDNPLRATTTTWYIGAENSNLSELFKDIPDSLSINGDLILNNAGNIFSFKDFFYDTSRIKVDLALQIPLNAQIQNLYLTDTLPVKQEWIDPIQKLKKGRFTFHASNPYPVSVQLGIHFLDSAFRPIEPLQSVSPILMPTSPKTIWYLTLDEILIAQMKNVKYIKPIAIFNTPGSQIQVFKSNEKINFQIMVEATNELQVK